MVETVNFGIIQQKVSNLLGESYFTGKAQLAKEVFSHFIDTLKSSKILMLEFQVYKNLENKFIKDENSAIRYIDKNLMLFEGYNAKEIITENKKLGSDKLNDIIISEEKTNLFNNIHTLIVENTSATPDIEKLHESFENILNYIRTEKNNEVITINENDINLDFIIKSSNKIFSERYKNNLTESEINVLKAVNKNDVNQLTDILENYKTKAIETVNSMSDTDNEYIKESIEKIKSMKYDKNTFISDLIQLNELIS